MAASFETCKIESINQKIRLDSERRAVRSIAGNQQGITAFRQ